MEYLGSKMFGIEEFRRFLQETANNSNKKQKNRFLLKVFFINLVFDKIK
jgi:hypothetical protein